MNKQNIINCNITKDLLPSYFEGICTQDTKNVVDQHLQECAQCRSLARLMRETDFVSVKTDYAEADYMKKIKHHLTKGLLGGMFLIAVILFGLAESITNNLTNSNCFALILPFLLIATNALFPVSAQQNEFTRNQKILACIGILSICYALVLSTIFAANASGWSAHNTWTFFLNESQIGPFLSIQLHAAAVYLSAVYIIEMCHSLSGKSVNFICMCIYLTGGCTILALESCLHILSDSRYWKIVVFRTAAIHLFEGIFVTLIIWIIREKKLRENS